MDFWGSYLCNKSVSLGGGVSLASGWLYLYIIKVSLILQIVRLSLQAFIYIM